MTFEAIQKQTLSCDYVGVLTAEILNSPQVLAVIVHGTGGHSIHHSKVIQTGMPQLDAEKQVFEVWRTDQSVLESWHGNICLKQTDELLLLSCAVLEEEDIAGQTQAIYQQMLTLAKQQAYPELLRAWNYIRDINAGDGDQERYRQFCLGRHEAFAAQQITPEQFPAASALGHASESLAIYMLCAKHAAVHVENPLQQSAYHYPREYGPKSPSFARATISADFGLVFISGTASIVGHETRYKDDLLKQLEQTLFNIDKLLEHIQASHDQALSLEGLKVYIRHSVDYPAIKSYLQQRYAQLPCLYLQADICRSDLLLEIEAVCQIVDP